MIEDGFLRTAQDERERLALLDAVTAWGIQATTRFPPELSVVVFGSLVRGDYWVGSDLDIIPIGGEERDRKRVIEELATIGKERGAKSTESWWPVSHELLRQLRSVPVEARRGPTYPIQFGLHGFDTVGHHITVLGRDPFVGFPVPMEVDLLRSATERLLAFKNPDHDWFDREGRATPEVIKVAVLLECARRNLAPSRNKYVVASLFDQLVSPFPGKDRWREVWRRYKADAAEPLDFEVQFRDALIGAVCPAP